MGGMQMGSMPQMGGMSNMQRMMMMDMDMPDQKIYRKTPFGGMAAYDVNMERSFMPNGQPSMIMEISDPDTVPYGMMGMGMGGFGGNMMMPQMGGQVVGQMRPQTLGRQQNGGRGGMSFASTNMVQQPQQMVTSQGLTMSRRVPSTSRPMTIMRQQPVQQQQVRYVTQSSFPSSTGGRATQQKVTFTMG